MYELKLIVRCSACGARNRVRLVRGKKVRVRCGFCGEQMPVGKGLITALALRQAFKSFFASWLPLSIIAVVDTASALLGLIIKPIKSLLSLLPLKARRRLGWGSIILLSVAFMVLEGTLKLTSMFILLILLALAMIALILAARGPSTLKSIMGQVMAGIFRRCPYCGHRHFGWLKSCPSCGEDLRGH